MASTGFTLAGAGASVSAGGSQVDWTNPGNITSSNDARATSSVTGKGGDAGNTDYLHATSFGFEVPSGATIDGIEVRIERSDGASGGAIADHTVQLIVGGSRSGDNNADTVTSWPAAASEASVDYGGASDLWGLSLSPDDVNASNFGVAVRAQYDGSGGTATDNVRVDAIWINVHYTEGASGPPPRSWGYIMG